MVKADKEALECDLAEYYRIYDMKSLPIQKIAVYAKGLSDDSRIKRKLNGCSFDYQTMILAGISDAVNWLVWSKTVDGSKNRNKPASLLAQLYRINDKKNIKSGKDFEKERQRILEEIRKEGKWQEQN